MINRYIYSPFTWASSGFIVGLALGVSTISVWILAIGFFLFLIWLNYLGPANEDNEGWRFSAAPAFMMSWILGILVNSLIN
ncbi:hypothetical protein OAJ59_00215 [bacterium]|jgi:hypothetical protein|nr:hypothetical protein [bacterium]|tara:strand:+ start:290 stop:532 length:243 start_codon:yes stop_codon:yes gene_type:complete